MCIHNFLFISNFQLTLGYIDAGEWESTWALQ